MKLKRRYVNEEVHKLFCQPSPLDVKYALEVLSEILS